jgi:hypothetical protein
VTLFVHFKHAVSHISEGILQGSEIEGKGRTLSPLFSLKDGQHLFDMKVLLKATIVTEDLTDSSEESNKFVFESLVSELLQLLLFLKLLKEVQINVSF